MTQFTDLGLAEPILRAVTAAGYDTPTPIQAQVIPEMLTGRDVLGIAQTGTGKTASFVLPLLHRIFEAKTSPKPKTASVLILAPTRELAAQILDSIRTYAKYMRLTTALVVGGAKPLPQIRKLQPGVDIVVATPGRLLDHAGTGAIRLHRTTAVVLDEADQMMDLGFLPAIRQIMEKLPEQRQTLLLSATMPKQIAGLAQDFLNDPAEIAVAPQSRPIERITQKVIHLDRRAKRRKLVDLVSADEVERCVVFTRTKHGADNVQGHLEKFGLSAAAIHGNKSQGQRDRTLRGFRDGSVKILVATDIAARGIDVDGVTHVVNYDLPNVPESYVHRIGRTGRAGKSGIAYSLCDSSERRYLREIEKLIGMSLDSEVLPFEVSAAPMRHGDVDGERKDRPRKPHPRRQERNGDDRQDRPRKPRPQHHMRDRDGEEERRERPFKQRPQHQMRDRDGDEARRERPFKQRPQHQVREGNEEQRERSFKQRPHHNGKPHGARPDRKRDDLVTDARGEHRAEHGSDEQRARPAHKHKSRPAGNKPPRRRDGNSHNHGRSNAHPESSERGLSRKRDAAGARAKSKPHTAKPRQDRGDAASRRDGTS